MTKESLLKFIEEEYGVNADYPFSKEYAPSPVLRHKDNKKWFALGMYIPKSRLGENSSQMVWVFNFKCDPLFKTALLEKKGFYVAYHMSKEHWISVVLEEADEDDLLFALSMSYDLTKAKYKKKKSERKNKKPI